MSRLVQVGSVLKAQLDFYVSPGSTVRAVGLSVNDIAPVLFRNNVQLGWPVVDGGNVLDSAISAGALYFNEISGAPGYYSLRFYPDSTGFWRVVSPYGDIDQILEFDFVSSSSLIPTNDGFITSFVG